MERGVVVVCRCNDVTLDDLMDALRMGIDDFELLRRYLKIGFGPCQGRGCVMIVARYFARFYAKRLDEVLANYRIRPPLLPIPLRSLAIGGD